MSSSTTAFRSRTWFRFVVSAGVVVSALGMSGCRAAPLLSTDSDLVQVVTTTGLLRDLVEQVGGDRIETVSIVPDGADPHSYEPTLRDARNVVYADVAFSNYAMLEQHNVITTLDANLSADAVSVSLAEESSRYGAELIQLVENAALDTVWLGMRADGDGSNFGATRSSQVVVSAVEYDGPGALSAYLTGTFGDTEVLFSSADGTDSGTGYRDDSVILPAAAHTHLSWAFDEPGLYTVKVSAQLQVDQTSAPISLAQGTFQIAVGVPPPSGLTVIDSGHADLTVDLDQSRLGIRYEPEGDSAVQFLGADEAVIVVPSTTVQPIPADPGLRFLGKPGDLVYQLPQAVLGRHIHGEIDPHLWQSVPNTMAYVKVIRDTLIAADPQSAQQYQQRAASYLEQLDALDQYVQEQISQIPADRRQLVTTHDAFGYLAQAYDLQIAGFVTPNPASEPSLADRQRLTQTLRTLQVPAVFLEPNLVARSSTLTQVATDLNITVCPIYGDAFDQQVHTYIQMMRFNADSLRECLAVDS